MNKKLLLLFFCCAALQAKFIPDEMDAIPDEVLNKAETTNEANASSCEILRILESTGAPQLFSHDLFLGTEPLSAIARPLVSDVVFFRRQTDLRNYHDSVRLTWFWNETPKQSFGRGTAIKDYLALADQTVLNDIINNEQLKGFNLKELFNRICPVRIEDRRTGIILDWFHNVARTGNRLSFELFIPFLYQETNFNMTEEEQALLKKVELLQGGAKSDKEAEKEIKKHVVSDAIGVGDIFLRSTYLMYESDHLAVKFGPEILLPSSFALKRGLVGSDFRCPLETPSISIEELLALVADKKIDNIKEFGTDFLLRFANRLGCMTLNRDLDSKFLTIGLLLEPTWLVNECVIVDSFISASYSFPRTQGWFYLATKDPNLFKKSRFEADSRAGNEAKCAADVHFLETQLINTLFPAFLDTYVEPNMTINIMIAPELMFKLWSFKFGYNFWYQQSPDLTITDDCAQRIPYNMQKASLGNRTQSKLFAEILIRRSMSKYDFSFSIFGEEAIATHNIGRDFTVGAHFMFNF